MANKQSSLSANFQILLTSLQISSNHNKLHWLIFKSTIKLPDKSFIRNFVLVVTKQISIENTHARCKLNVTKSYSKRDYSKSTNKGLYQWLIRVIITKNNVKNKKKQKSG